MSLTDEQVDTIVRWVDGGAPQGDPKDLPPPKPLVTDNEWKGGARRLRPARPRREVVRVHDAGAAPGRLVPADVGHPAHRAALGQDGRDSSDQPEGAQDHSPLDRLPRAEQRSRRRQHRHRERPGPLRRRRRPREPPPAADGVGDRQGLRPVPSGHRQAARAGREDLLGSAHSRGRRRDHRRLGNRHLVLQERRGAEEAQLPHRLHRHRSHEDARHPAELDGADRRLHGAEGERAHRELPAALPSARQGDAGRGDSAGRQRSRSSATSATSTSTG